MLSDYGRFVDSKRPFVFLVRAFWALIAIAKREK
jgi:hypothetical protein